MVYKSGWIYFNKKERQFVIKLRWQSSKNRTNEPFMSIAGYFEDASSDERRLCCSLWWIEREIIL